MEQTSWGRRVRLIRLDYELSQAQFAERVKEAGERLGDPNACTKRLVQKWESGEHSECRPNYRRALSEVTGVPFMVLCAPWVEPRGHDVARPQPGEPVDIASVLDLIDIVMTQLADVRLRLGADPRSGKET